MRGSENRRGDCGCQQFGAREEGIELPSEDCMAAPECIAATATTTTTTIYFMNRKFHSSYIYDELFNKD